MVFFQRPFSCFIFLHPGPCWSTNLVPPAAAPIRCCCAPPLLFYFWGERVYTVIMLLSTAIGL